MIELLKMATWPRLLLIIIVLSLPDVSSAQLSISGRVVDSENGEALAGAHVRLDGTFRTGVSNSTGDFILEGIKPGRYNIEVSYIGYSPFSESIDVVLEPLRITVSMQASPIMGEEVTVRASRVGAETPVAFTNMDSKQIRDLNLGQDIPYLIESTPSVVSTSDAGAGIGYTSFRVRGTDLNRINVTINGIPFNDAESHGVFWVDLPDMTSSLEDLQIVRGVGTSTQGAGAFGASVNFRTKAPSLKPYSTVSLSGGSFNTFRGSLALGSGLIDGHWAFEGRASRISSDGYVDRAWSELGSYYLGAAYFGKTESIQAKIFSGKETTYQAWDGIPSVILDTNRTYNGIGQYEKPDGSMAYFENETDNYRQDHYQLFYSKQLNNKTSFSIALHYTRGIGFYEQYKKDRTLEDYLIEPLSIGDTIITTSDIIQRWFLDNHFYGGVFTFEKRFKLWELIAGGGWNTYQGEHYGKVIWAEWASGTEMNQEWYRNSGTKVDMNLYSKANYHISKSLNAFADVQGRFIKHEIIGIDNDLRDITQTNDFSFFNPKLGLFYKAGSMHDLYLYTGIAHREPNRSNFTDADPDGPIPTAERLLDFEFGYTIKQNFWQAGIGLYWMLYHDQLVLTGEINDVGAPIMTNVEKSYRRGIELQGSWKPFRQLEWDANITFSENKIQDFVAFIDDWDNGGQVIQVLGNTDIAFSPNLIAANRLIWSSKTGFAVTLGSKYVSRQYIDNTSAKSRSLDPYLIHNLKLLYSPGRRKFGTVEIHLAINNILGAKYESNAWIYRYYAGGDENLIDGYFPQAGRHFLAGINFRF